MDWSTEVGGGGSELERVEAARLQQRASVVVGEGDDVLEDVLDRTGVALALLARRPAGERLEFTDQRLELAVVLPVHGPKPARQVADLAGGGAVQRVVFAQRLADGHRRLEYRRVQLAGA